MKAFYFRASGDAESVNRAFNQVVGGMLGAITQAVGPWRTPPAKPIERIKQLDDIPPTEVREPSE